MLVPRLVLVRELWTSSILTTIEVSRARCWFHGWIPDLIGFRRRCNRNAIVRASAIDADG
jgi:hypothetical protein